MADSRYHVSRFGEKWTIIRDETEIAAFPLRRTAIEVAARIAREDSPSQLFIHNDDGSVERDEKFR